MIGLSFRDLLTMLVLTYYSCWAQSIAHAQQQDAIGQAIRRGSSFLIAAQQADGSWQSDRYGNFRDGMILTPLVAAALAQAEVAGSLESASRAALFLEKRLSSHRVKKQTTDTALPYPAYTLSATIHLLIQLEAKAQSKRLYPVVGSVDLTMRAELVQMLKGQQLTEDNGFEANHPFYGGWGYADLGQVKCPEPGQTVSPLLIPNISATARAVEALVAAGVPTDWPGLLKAQQFVCSLQNWPAENQPYQAEYDDGGFFFIAQDSIRNKASVAGSDRQGRQRFHSYGSTTVDGASSLLALQFGNVLPRSPLVGAATQALRWLDENFDARANPGKFSSDRIHYREAAFHYYALGFCRCAHYGHRLGCLSLTMRQQVAALVHELLARQAADGSWAATQVDLREDDPLVSTPMTIQALSFARDLNVEKH